jgi:hypothetical protein
MATQHQTHPQGIRQGEPHSAQHLAAGATGYVGVAPRDAITDELVAAATALLDQMHVVGITEKWADDLKTSAAIGRLQAACVAAQP